MAFGHSVTNITFYAKWTFFMSHDPQHMIEGVTWSKILAQFLTLSHQPMKILFCNISIELSRDFLLILGCVFRYEGEYKVQNILNNP